METVSAGRARREYRGADYPWHLSWFGRRTEIVPELEYRTCATTSKADAKAAAERMIGRRETYMSGAA